MGGKLTGGLIVSATNSCDDRDRLLSVVSIDVSLELVEMVNELEVGQ